ncbi:serine hydrolase [Actinoalloteichus hymeniacidonis]|uniref:Beta-lactamase enzyme family n=1 Tax=Actinoalloteichus hymeniacidonis TaxID=340345 RepID=A0AAC9HRS2_9PSEU|nr:serine hydrolase [Actinoalloteichus hymeniacidonis]AOS64387.1 Beta-lactamase enzyme family [Actinoalloteichus hymeniacidonis]MBB5907545.1 hypothetical protein [Actinoalloteichus hymeniacidonis]
MRWQPFLLSGLLLVTGCGADASSATPPGEPSPAAAVESASDSTEAGEPFDWLGHLESDQDNVSVIFDDGRGTAWSTGADEPVPFASTRKILHLAAYSLGVADGSVGPESTVTLREWQSWYVPDTDGGAHPAALEALGIDPADADHEVPIDDVVNSMIVFSDNAATDLVRDHLGDDRLHAAAAQIGWEPTELPSMLGSLISLLMPNESETDHDVLAERFREDAEFRDQVLTEPLPSWDRQIEWANEAGLVAPRHLHELHKQLVEDGLGEAIAREIAIEHLSWTAVDGLTAKGGSMPGQISESWALRNPDGTLASITFAVHDMPQQSWLTAVMDFSHQTLLHEALTDPETATRLRNAVGAE